MNETSQGAGFESSAATAPQGSTGEELPEEDYYQLTATDWD